MTDQQGWAPPQQPPREQGQQPYGVPQQPSQQQPGNYGGAPAPSGYPPPPGYQQPPPGDSYPPQQGYPSGPDHQAPTPPRKRHRVRNTTLGVVGAIVLIIIIATVANANHTAASRQHVASGTSATKAVSTPSAPTYTAAQNAWYNEVLAKYPQISGGTEKQIVSVGNQVCTARQAGGTQAQLVSATAGKLGSSARSFVRAAEKALCPSEVPVPPQVLLNFSGNGIENSAPFLVNSSQVTVTYSFNCSSFGGSGNFIADLEYGNQSSLNSDDQSIANQLAPSGHATTSVYPQDPGNNYYVAVNSECSWSVKVESP